jgi:hypothetical protein
MPGITTYRERIQPLSHRSDLPHVSLSDKLRLGLNVQDTIAIPVVTAAVDEVFVDSTRVDRRIASACNRCMIVDAVPNVSAYIVSRYPMSTGAYPLPSIKAKFIAVIFRSPYLL